jgi:hypothetical protein
LSDIWINSVGVVHCQHFAILLQAPYDGRGMCCLDYWLLRWHRATATAKGCPCIPTLTSPVERGTYSPPNPPTVNLG